MTSTDNSATGSAERTLEVDITGMTCASCVNRIERKLGKLPGVTASVNLPLEHARVTVPAELSTEKILQTIEQAGFGAKLSKPVTPLSTDPTTSTENVDTGEGRERTLEVDITGMTCASCVNRIERKLGKLPGVTASVNLPLEHARITMPADVSPDEILQTIEQAGYGATLSHPETPSATKPEDAALAMPTTPDEDEKASASRALMVRLIGAAVLTTPVFAISMFHQLQFPHWGWVVFILTTPVVFWSAWPFHRNAAINLRHGGFTMDTLVSLGVLAAYLYSAVHLIMDPGMTAHVLHAVGEPTDLMGKIAAALGMAGMESHQLYFESAAVVTTFLLAGRYIEAKAKTRAADALTSLIKLAPQQAQRRNHDGTETTVAVTALREGDLCVVRPGEKIPTDGVITEGHSAVDTSLITGESVPEEVVPGDHVTGGTVNTSGWLVLEVTRVGADTTLSRLTNLVADAQSAKAPIARLADRISGVFVPIVLVLAALTFLGWWIFGSNADGNALGTAFRIGVSVLVIACPCALGLATPVGILAGTGRGAQLGILISGPQVLEDTRNIDTVVLDKTGTITEGKLTVTDVYRPAGARLDAAAVLEITAAAESGSEHPLAAGIMDHVLLDAESEDRRALRAKLEGFSATIGGGIEATVKHDDCSYTAVVGARQFVEKFVADGAEFSPEDLARDEQTVDSGSAAIWVIVDGQPEALFALVDTVKEHSQAGLERLKKLGLHPVLLTGDNLGVARRVAAEVGIAEADVYASASPQDKVELVSQLQEQGHVVAMAGDGVNDAAALAQADIGVAMASGTDVAMHAADITLMRSGIDQLADAIELSQKTLHIIKMNLFWAFFYNVIGLGLAVAGLLNPMIAGAAMAFSSVLVVLNSLRLTMFKRG